jgi:predicted permease
VLDTALRLLPVLAAIAAGALLRAMRLARPADGEFVLRLVFAVGLAPLMLLSTSRVELDGRLAVFAAVPPALAVAGHLAGRLVARSAGGRAAFAGTRLPVLLIASMMVNTGFTLPFTQALYGAEGVARLGVADAASALVTFTWAYWTAARGGPGHGGSPVVRLLRNPPLYGVVAGLALNVTGHAVPPLLAEVLSPFAAATPFLLALGTGILLALPRRGELGPAATIVATRLATGAVTGAAIVWLAGLQGMDATLVALIAVAPVAFVTVTFAALERLDVRLAAAALSLSLGTSLVLCTVVGLLVS